MSRPNSFKALLFDQFARMAKALSNGNRLELLEFLAQGRMSVEALSKTTGLSVANTSQHLRQLRQAGLVTAQKQGLKVYYQLSGEDVFALLAALRASAERHLAEVDQLVHAYLTVKDDLEAIPREELLKRARQGQITVLDVRPEAEYELGHLPGAINVPLSELEQQLESLDPTQEIVAYCRGPHCILAYEAVARLRQHGRKAHRLQDGYPEWKAAGLPVKTDEESAA